VVVYRQFDEPKVALPAETDAAKLMESIARSSIPTLIEFSENTTEEIFGNSLPKVETPRRHHPSTWPCR
jgi:hypothetical protein